MLFHDDERGLPVDYQQAILEQADDPVDLAAYRQERLDRLQEFTPSAVATADAGPAVSPGRPSQAPQGHCEEAPVATAIPFSRRRSLLPGAGNGDDLPDRAA